MRKAIIAAILISGGAAFGQATNDRPVMISSNGIYSAYGGSWAMLGFSDISGTNTTTKYAWVPSSGLRVTGTKAATFTDRGDFGAWEFSDNQDEQIVGNVKVPDDWDGTSDFTMCVGWESPTTNANCVWEITWLWTAQDEPTTNSGYTCSSTNASSTNAAGLVQSEACTLTNAQANSVCAHLKVMRDGNSAGDTLGAAAYLHGIAIKYTSNRP